MVHICTTMILIEWLTIFKRRNCVKYWNKNADISKIFRIILNTITSTTVTTTIEIIKVIIIIMIIRKTYTNI